MFDKVVLGLVFLGIFQLNFIFTNKTPNVDKCDPTEFFKPYVKILRKIGEKPLFEMPSAGFVDLRTQIGVTLCVNGPAYIYTAIEEEGNLTRYINDATVFKDGTLKMYEHSCFLINRLVNPGSKSTAADSDPDDPTKYHRVDVIQTSSVPYLMEASEVHGIKAFGISLLGIGSNYRLPSMFMFLEQKFGYNDENLVISASFAIIGKHPFQVYDKYTNSTLTITPDHTITENMLCTREEGKDGFDKAFQRGHNRTDYKFKKLPIPPPPVAPVPPVPAPAPVLSNEEKIGRMMDPNLLGKGYWHSSLTPEVKVKRKKGKKGKVGGENGSHYRFDFPKDFESGRPYYEHSVEIPAANCVKLPEIDAAACSGTSNGTTPCEVLKAILELEDYSAATLQVMTELAWKRNILTSVEETFAKICPQINERALQAVASVYFRMFIVKIHEANTSLPRIQDTRWVTLLQELEHCRADATPLQFTVVSGNTGDNNLSSTPYVQPNFFLAGENAGDPMSMVPDDSTDVLSTTQAPPVPKKRRSVQVKRFDGSMAPVFHYEEAAEGDFDFNLPIDFQWKMFSTVLGYCNKLYTQKKASVFPMMLQLFNDDFLALDTGAWTNPQDNEIYVQFMGDTGNWLSECLEGGYIHAGAEDYRPVRPLLVNEGQHLNYFTVVPSFT